MKLNAGLGCQGPAIAFLKPINEQILLFLLVNLFFLPILVQYTSPRIACLISVEHIFPLIDISVNTTAFLLF